MSFGIRFTPDDGGKPVVLDGARYVSNLGTVTMSTKTRQISIKQPPTGSTTMIIPRNIIYLGFTDNVGIPETGYIKSYSISGNHFNYDFYASTSYSLPDFSGNIGVADIFSVSGIETNNSYGVRVINGSDFMAINDKSYLGFVTYRGVISINGRWSIPKSILDLGNYVVFCHWNDSGTPLYLNRDNNSIECYGGFRSANGSSVSGTVNNVYIVILSCGFSPGLPNSKKGLVIRNSAGEITYSSKYAPVKWSGAYYNMPGFERYDSTGGGYEQWVSPSGNVSLPMLPLCSIGFQRGDSTRQGRTWNFSPVLYSGFKMSGNRVTSYRARTADSSAPIGLYPSYFEVSCRIPCIDAIDYF